MGFVKQKDGLRTLPFLPPQEQDSCPPHPVPSGWKPLSPRCPSPETGQVDVLIDLDFRFELRNRGIWGEGATWSEADSHQIAQSCLPSPPLPWRRWGTKAM